MGQQLSPPPGYATWLDYAVDNMETRSLEIDSLITASFTELPPHWPEGATREEMDQAARDELSMQRLAEHRLETALRLLVEIEPHLNEWDFCITSQSHLKQFLDGIYGESRPVL